MKLIAIDMDGTLLSSQNKIPHENIEAIRKAQKKGIEVVISTGRSYPDASKLMKEAGLVTWIIGANGATIHDPSGTCVQAVSLSREQAEEILAYFEARSFYYEVFSKQSIFSPNNGHELVKVEMDRILTANPYADREEMKEAAERQFSQEPFHFVTSYKEILQETNQYFNLLAFSYDEEKLQEAWDRYAGRRDLALTASASHVFDIMHPDVSKGNAVRKLADQFGVKTEETMAIGDNFNDISMFEAAGRSVAMGNAPEGVKEKASAVTLSNDEFGVAHAIRQLL